MLWGNELHYSEVLGSGPLLLFLHGVGSSSATWQPILERLSEHDVHAVALDLPGHGGSAKVRGDYSLGAMACTVRDFLDYVGEKQAVLVGHSLGGGIAMQFAYQFPDRCNGLVLVASGGLGAEASVVLRAASLPGAELVLPLIVHPATMSAVGWASRTSSRLGGPAFLSADAEILLRGLRDPTSRAAFLSTLRSVIDHSGQRVSAVAKLAAAKQLPTLLVWGECDPIIPLDHGHRALDVAPDASLVVIPGARHEPHRHDPARFTDLVVELADQVRSAGGGTSFRAGSPSHTSTTQRVAESNDKLNRRPSRNVDAQLDE